MNYPSFDKGSLLHKQYDIFTASSIHHLNLSRAKISWKRFYDWTDTPYVGRYIFDRQWGNVNRRWCPFVMGVHGIHLHGRSLQGLHGLRHFTIVLDGTPRDMTKFHDIRMDSLGIHWTQTLQSTHTYSRIMIDVYIGEYTWYPSFDNETKVPLLFSHRLSSSASVLRWMKTNQNPDVSNVIGCSSWMYIIHVYVYLIKLFSCSTRLILRLLFFILSWVDENY